MEQATLDKIFDLYFTTKSGGRGLGMSSVLGIIRRHKVAIKISSKPGKGSRFTVLLPAFSNSWDIQNLNAGQYLRIL
jgi:signal transduction histidine kinase